MIQHLPNTNVVTNLGNDVFLIERPIVVDGTIYSHVKVFVGSEILLGDEAYNVFPYNPTDSSMDMDNPLCHREESFDGPGWLYSLRSMAPRFREATDVQVEQPAALGHTGQDRQIIHFSRVYTQDFFDPGTPMRVDHFDRLVARVQREGFSSHPRHPHLTQDSSLCVTNGWSGDLQEIVNSMVGSTAPEDVTYLREVLFCLESSYRCMTDKRIRVTVIKGHLQLHVPEVGLSIQRAFKAAVEDICRNPAPVMTRDRDVRIEAFDMLAQLWLNSLLNHWCKHAPVSWWDTCRAFGLPNLLARDLLDNETKLRAVTDETAIGLFVNTRPHSDEFSCRPLVEGWYFSLLRNRWKRGTEDPYVRLGSDPIIVDPADPFGLRHAFSLVATPQT